MNEITRCYTFTNFMLSPIQQGIQSGHAAMELVNKYCYHGTRSREYEQVMEWVKYHKTIVCLNGGNYDGVCEWEKLFEDPRNTFPFASFREDLQSLDGMLTSVAILLPERIYDVDLEELYSMASFVPGQFTEYEWQLVNAVKSTSLAR